MNDLPRTPEGRLIRRTREKTIPKLSIRAAAARIGLSPEQWGYAERGYLPSRGGAPEREFHPPAVTLAHIAAALRITPKALETEGERPDAAEVMRRDERGGRAAEAEGDAESPPGVLPPFPSRTAQMLFPGDRNKQLIWDMDDEDEETRAEMIAVLERKRRDPGSRGDSLTEGTA